MIWCYPQLVSVATMLSFSKGVMHPSKYVWYFDL